ILLRISLILRDIIITQLNFYILLISWDYEIFKWILEDVPFFSAKFVYDEHQNLIEKTVNFYEK
ncbi:hypothetical protein UW656_06160, partial [Streptococcus agalactiae]